jgi:hypothetical protein
MRFLEVSRRGGREERYGHKKWGVATQLHTSGANQPRDFRRRGRAAYHPRTPDRPPLALYEPNTSHPYGLAGVPPDEGETPAGHPRPAPSAAPRAPGDLVGGLADLLGLADAAEGLRGPCDAPRWTYRTNRTWDSRALGLGRGPRSPSEASCESLIPCYRALSNPHSFARPRRILSTRNRGSEREADACVSSCLESGTGQTNSGQTSFTYQRSRDGGGT